VKLNTDAQNSRTNLIFLVRNRDEGEWNMREGVGGCQRGYESFLRSCLLPSFAEQTAKRPRFIYAQACFMASFLTWGGR